MPCREHLLGLLVQRQRLLARGLGGLHQLRVELRVGVVAVVARRRRCRSWASGSSRCAGSPGSIRTGTSTPSSGHRSSGGRWRSPGRGWRHSRPPARRTDRVARRGDPTLVVRVGVVGDRELAAVEPTGLWNRALARSGSKVQKLPTGPGVEALDAGRAPAVGRLARALELVVDDLLAVDGHRDRVSKPGVLVGGVHVCPGEADRLDAPGRPPGPNDRRGPACTSRPPARSWAGRRARPGCRRAGRCRRPISSS